MTTPGTDANPPARDADPRGYVVSLMFFLCITFVAGAIGSTFTGRAVRTWFEELVHPAARPPNWVFAPVWTFLYALMAVAAWLVWRRGGTTRAGGVAVALFFIQLVLNALWPYLFFGLRRFDAALAELGLLWLAIVATMIAFFRVRPLAGWLLVPYLAWVTFAGWLNWRYVVLN